MLIRPTPRHPGPRAGIQKNWHNTLLITGQVILGKKEVEAILNEKTRAAARIERCLDGLLDFCFDHEALALYKRFCRFYHEIDPAATA